MLDSASLKIQRQKIKKKENLGDFIDQFFTN